MKINKKELLLTSLVCLLPLLAGVALYPRLPETMATHWGFDGTANVWSSRAATVFGLPLLSRPVLPMAGMPAGGFIVLGILCAIWRALAQYRKNYLKTEARNTVAVHHQKEANREHE